MIEKTLVDVVVHKNDVTLTPLTTYDIARDEIKLDLWTSERMRVDINLGKGRYGSTIFFDHWDGRYRNVHNFEFIRDGEWYQIKFLNDGAIWIFEYRCRI